MRVDNIVSLEIVSCRATTKNLIFHTLLTIIMRNNKWIARIMLASAYPALYLTWVNFISNMWVIDYQNRSKMISFIHILMSSIPNLNVLPKETLRKSMRRQSITKNKIYKAINYDFSINEIRNL